MVSRRFPAPSGVSGAARRFIVDAAPIAKRDVNREAIVAERRALYDAYAPISLAAQKAVGASIEESELSGVRVQWVSPARVRHADVILYFFGGGHVTGSPTEDLAITARLADFTGRRVCAPYYRLAPEHPYPAAVEDALAVYRWLLKEHGARSLAVSGESAGGNLALALIGAAAKQGLALPAAAALLSPWADLTHSGDTIATLSGIDPTLDADLNLDTGARVYAGKEPLGSPGVSPLFADVPKGFPPTLITTGTRDLLLSDCARLSTKLRAAGVEAELRVTEGMWHVFEFYPDLPEAEASLKGISEFLDKRLSSH